MRIIIYALGKVYERQKQQIDWSQVIALSDKFTYPGMKIDGMNVISPDQINSTEYDYIAVFSNKFYEEIRMELTGEYAIPQNKILPWTEMVKEKKETTSQMLKEYCLFLEAKACERILDVGMQVLSKYYLIKAHLLSNDRVVLDGVLSNKEIINNSLYDNVYKSFTDCKDSYDAVLIWGELESIEAQLSRFKNGKTQTKYILFHTGYLCEDKPARESLYMFLQKYGTVSSISNLWGILWIVDTQHQKRYADMQIYVVMHKKYNVQPNELYVPLCVGGFQFPEYLTEEAGDNIAYLNPKINECTALYWIWKNTNTKYVGLNHYRRFFYNNEIKSIDNQLDMTNAVDILQNFDIILTKVSSLGTVTVYEQIYNSIDHELCEKGYHAIKRNIEKYQPEYLQAFDDVMKGHITFLCNMFITRREILNSYCEWLFSFLLEAAEEVDVEEYDGYSRRVIGFFAERLWTVWLRRNKLRIKEMPYVIIK